jgi:hypothetical protein
LKRYLDPDPNDINATPLLLCCESARGFLDGLGKARFKQGATKLAFNTIEGRSLEAFDSARYLVSRQPVFVRRAPNRIADVYRTDDTKPYHVPEERSVDDPFAIEPWMNADEQLYRRRLKYSAEMVASLEAGQW